MGQLLDRYNAQINKPGTQRCVNCGRGWQTETGMIGCGAAVDTTDHPNPIWHIRRISWLASSLTFGDGPQSPVAAGRDPDRMYPFDGESCKAWKAKEAGPQPSDISQDGTDSG